MTGDGRGSHGDAENTEVQKEISHKDAHNAQKEKATEKKKVCWAGVTCRAVRYADMDRWTPGYTNEFAYQGVSRSARPADAGQRSMRP